MPIIASGSQRRTCPLRDLHQVKILDPWPYHRKKKIKNQSDAKLVCLLSSHKRQCMLTNKARERERNNGGMGWGNGTICEKNSIHLGIGFSRESHLADSEVAVHVILWLP